MVICINVYNKYLLIAKFEYHFESTSICWIAKFGAPEPHGGRGYIFFNNKWTEKTFSFEITLSINLYILKDRKDMYRYISLQFQDLGSYEGHLPPKGSVVLWSCQRSLYSPKHHERQGPFRSILLFFNSDPGLLIWWSKFQVRALSILIKARGIDHSEGTWGMPLCSKVCNFGVRTCPVDHYWEIIHHTPVDRQHS